MQVLQLDEPKTEALFATMFEQRNLVPVLGAGFSKLLELRAHPSLMLRTLEKRCLKY